MVEEIPDSKSRILVVERISTVRSLENSSVGKLPIKDKRFTNIGMGDSANETNEHGPNMYIEPYFKI